MPGDGTFTSITGAHAGKYDLRRPAHLLGKPLPAGGRQPASSRASVPAEALVSEYLSLKMANGYSAEEIA